ncbi:MAG: hypothetical protein ACRDSF_27090, partial [Pseudonocardiaceae bacterium]
CPHCGCPLLATQGTVRLPDAEAVDLLHREIDQLRATIARLRGAGFNGIQRAPDEKRAPS